MIGHVLPFVLFPALVGGTILALLTALMRRRGRGISILIPFYCADPTNPRIRNVEWLKKYWKAHLPGAEIVIGEDWGSVLHGKPFSKSVAVNNAARKAKGDVLVIVDADGYISADSVLHCAEEIRAARKKDRRLWFIPYRQFYRLTEEASGLLLGSDPAKPYIFPEPLPAKYILGDTDPKVGAMIQILPREAFDAVGGWDERFRGWGGEDHAAMRATDTLYWQHKTLPGQVLHVWHPQIGPQGTANVVHWKERMWENQTETGVNDRLSNKYYGAHGRPDAMRKLVDEGRNAKPEVGKGNGSRRRSSI
jgi:hypothetical protein